MISDLESNPGIQGSAEGLYWNARSPQKHSQRFLEDGLAGERQHDSHDNKTTGFFSN